MGPELLFHEKCTTDVKAILNSFRYYDANETDARRKEFLLRLTETYQNIFENFQVDDQSVIDLETIWNDGVKKFIAPVSNFMHLVVYAILPGKIKKIVILGVISTRNYHELIAREGLA